MASNLNAEELKMREAAKGVIGAKASSCFVNGHALDDQGEDCGADGGAWCYCCNEMSEADSVQAPVLLDPLTVLRVLDRLEGALELLREIGTIDGDTRPDYCAVCFGRSCIQDCRLAALLNGGTGND